MKINYWLTISFMTIIFQLLIFTVSVESVVARTKCLYTRKCFTIPSFCANTGRKKCKIDYDICGCFVSCQCVNRPVLRY